MSNKFISSEALNEIRRRGANYLSRDSSGKGWICPICGSGSGRNGTGITSKDGGIHFTCWAGGCFTNADIIDVIGAQYSLTGWREKVECAAELLGVSFESVVPAPAHRAPAPDVSRNEADYSSFIKAAALRIGETDYHRGITLETLKKYRVGFDPAWKNPAIKAEIAQKVPASPRLIVPTSRSSYLARDTRAAIPDSQKKYAKSKVGKTRIFNLSAIRDAAVPVFIVEGEIDALSVIDVGGVAVGLGSVSMVRKFLDAVAKLDKVMPRFVVCLDNDDRGREAAARLKDGLSACGAVFVEADITCGAKDPNDALVRDRDAFALAVADAMERAADAGTLEQQETVDLLQSESAASSLQAFVNDIFSLSGVRPVSTGFPGLDALLDGGLYPGLYVVGAITSLGKTTFCLQIADNIAKSGRDVVIFSLEMSRSELMAKSVSRLSMLADLEKNVSTMNARTTRGVLTGYRRDGFSEKTKAVLRDALEEYATYAGHIYIVEGMGDIGTQQIRERVEAHAKASGAAPVVLVDYLQILAPHDPRSTDKQNTDKAVLELKRLSRDMDIPIIGVSSFNRDNYLAEVNLASFKESGAIEYSSDVLVGLQYSCMEAQEGEDSKTSEKRVRAALREVQAAPSKGIPQDVQARILKNRNGSRGSVSFEFYPMFNYYTEKKQIKEA